MNICAELIRQRSGALGGPVRQMDDFDAALDQSEHHRARRAARAEHQRLLSRIPSARAGVEIIDKALDVGVGRVQLAALIPQRVGRTDRAGARIRLGQCQCTFLVRNGDVGADKAVRRKTQYELGKEFGRHRLDAVAALDAERAQPVVVDQRRARMRSRPSDQACGAGFGLGHISQIGQAAAAVNAADPSGAHLRQRSRSAPAR